MFKLILCLVIIGACGCLGIMKGQGFTERLRDLEDLKHMIELLETEMSYRKDPLPNAFARISAYKDNRAMDLLWEASQQVKENAAGFHHCWNQAAETVYGNSYLHAEDRQILKDLGLQLGKSDIQGQASMFALVNTKLDIQIKDAANEKKTKGKMYKGLGFSIGTVIAIILI